jgi:hypothetical protein
MDTSVDVIDITSSSICEDDPFVSAVLEDGRIVTIPLYRRTMKQQLEDLLNVYEVCKEEGGEYSLVLLRYETLIGTCAVPAPIWFVEDICM